MKSLQCTLLISSYPLSLMHLVHTTATHTFHLCYVGNDLPSGQIGFSIFLRRMCYDDCVSIVSCLVVLQACVQIYLLVKYLMPKMNTRSKWDIIQTGKKIFIYACNIFARYSTRSNFKLKLLKYCSQHFFENKQDRETHVETYVKKRTIKFQR